MQPMRRAVAATLKRKLMPHVHTATPSTHYCKQAGDTDAYRDLQRSVQAEKYFMPYILGDKGDFYGMKDPDIARRILAFDTALHTQNQSHDVKGAYERALYERKQTLTRARHGVFFSGFGALCVMVSLLSADPAVYLCVVGEALIVKHTLSQYKRYRYMGENLERGGDPAIKEMLQDIVSRDPMPGTISWDECHKKTEE